MAREHHVKFYHESTVMDGVPVFNLTDETLKGCKILEVSGILNATTNYVLSEMEHGISWEDAVAEGQRRGFVEADPSMDLDGWDAAAKLTALMNVLMDVEITPEEIQREGIRGITPEQMAEARQNHQRLKLLCRGWLEASPGYRARVDLPLLGGACAGAVAAKTYRMDADGETTALVVRIDEEGF